MVNFPHHDVARLDKAMLLGGLSLLATTGHKMPLLPTNAAGLKALW